MKCRSHHLIWTHTLSTRWVTAVDLDHGNEVCCQVLHWEVALAPRRTVTWMEAPAQPIPEGGSCVLLEGDSAAQLIWILLQVCLFSPIDLIIQLAPVSL